MVLRGASSLATLDAAREVGAAVSAYGHIITTIHFLMIDFFLCLCLNGMLAVSKKRLRKKQRRSSKQPSKLQIKANF